MQWRDDTTLLSPDLAIGKSRECSRRPLRVRLGHSAMSARCPKSGDSGALAPALLSSKTNEKPRSPGATLVLDPVGIFNYRPSAETAAQGSFGSLNQVGSRTATLVSGTVRCS